MLKNLLNDPKNHQLNNYVYLVYAFHPSNPALNTMEGINSTLERFQNLNKFYSSSLVGRLEPQIAHEKIGYNTMIDQTGTFGKVGLIIEPAIDEQVRIAWNCDLASASNEDDLSKFVTKHDGKIRQPPYLLTNTVGAGALKYNELILNGHPESKIRGVFYKGDVNNQIVATALSYIVGNILEIDLPVVQLAQDVQRPMEDSAMVGRVLGEFIASIPQIEQVRKEFYEK